MTQEEFQSWYLGNKPFDYDKPHVFSDYRIIQVAGKYWNGEPYTAYHVAYKWDDNEGWTNFVTLWINRGEWHINTTMRDEKFRFERVCERAGVTPHKRYLNFEQAAEDYIKIVKADNERFNSRFN